MKRELLILFLTCLILTVNSEARGIGLRSDNLKVGIDFVPNFESKYYYSVVPFSDEPMNVTLYVTDDSDDGTTTSLVKYFTVEPASFIILPKQEPYFTLNVNLPEKIDEPGTHKIHVIAREIIKETGGFGVSTAVEAIFFINVPFNGQYLRWSLDAKGANQGDPIPVKLSYSNLGKESIKELYANVKLFDSSGMTMTEQKTSTTNIDPQKSTSQNVEISTTEFVPGKYVINATIHYDGKEDSKGKEVKIGELRFEIINQTNEIISGKINPVEIEVESQWAENINGVYAQVKIADHDPIKTMSDSVEGFGKATLKGFFDATNLDPGTYDMIIKVYYEDKMTLKTTQINVVKENRFELPNLSTNNMIFIIAITIIVIINIILFLMLMKKKEDHEKGPE